MESNVLHLYSATNAPRAVTEGTVSMDDESEHCGNSGGMYVALLLVVDASFGC